MDGQDGRHGQAQTWNHASTGGTSPMRPLDGSSLKPLSPLQPMPGQAQGTPRGGQGDPRRQAVPAQPQYGGTPQPPQGAPQRMSTPQLWQGAKPAAAPQHPGSEPQPPYRGTAPQQQFGNGNTQPQYGGVAPQQPYSGENPQQQYGGIAPQQPQRMYPPQLWQGAQPAGGEPQPPYRGAAPQRQYGSGIPQQPFSGIVPQQPDNGGNLQQQYGGVAAQKPYGGVAPQQPQRMPPPQLWQGAQPPAAPQESGGEPPRPYSGSAPQPPYGGPGLQPPYSGAAQPQQQRAPVPPPWQGAQTSAYPQQTGVNPPRFGDPALQLPFAGVAPPPADEPPAERPAWLPAYIQPETPAHRDSAPGTRPQPSAAPQPAATDALGSRSPAGSIYAYREPAASAQPQPPEAWQAAAAPPPPRQPAQPVGEQADAEGTRRRRAVTHRMQDGADDAYAGQPQAPAYAQHAPYGSTPASAFGTPEPAPAYHDYFETQPDAYGDTAAPAYAGADAWPPEAEADAPYSDNSSGDAPDEDSARFARIEQAPLAEPATVPVSLTPPPRLKRKGRGALIALAAVLLLGAACAGLYYTGTLAKLYSALFPQATGGLPAVFGDTAGDAAGGAGVAPAVQAGQPKLLAASVSPAEGKAPAELLFTLETNADTSSVRLLTEDNATIHTTAYSTPKGDGLSWAVTATFAEPYTGKVRVFLRDAAGLWSVGELTCDVAVR